MSDYPQETIDTLRNIIEMQQAKIAQLQKLSDDMYTTATFYKAQWENTAEGQKAIKGVKE